jgi:type I restriction enzyme S subunit
MSPTSKTSAAEEEAKPVVVPKLRFPEFRGEESWENKLIGPYLEDCSGRVPPDTELPVYSSTREGLKRQDAYFDGRVLQNKNDYGVVPPGCLVYRHMSDDGLFKFNINETGGEIAVSKEYPVFSTKGLNSVFLLAKLNDGLDFKHFALSQKAGGTRTRLYFSRLCEWRTLLPYPAEQQKIAECLSSVDELLAAQARKVDALKTHKKGLMQQLFPREGETQPRLRFPEFENAGEWEEKALAEIVQVASGQVAPTQPPYNGLPQIGSENIESNTGKLVNVKSAGEKGVISGNYLFDENDVLYSKIRPALNKAAAPDFTGICSADIYPIRPANDALLRSYLLYLLLSDKYLEHAIRSSDRGKIPKINREDLLGYVSAIPKPPEQHRIATCLSSLDTLITAETQKYETLKTHKKGLMQQLFPSTEEYEP